VGFCYGRRAPDPFGKKGATFPWFQVVRRYDGGSENIELDFLGAEWIAFGIAYQRNLKDRKDH
jgi:hypothetical protein